MCVVWVLALFTVIHDHWPLSFCAGILDAALRYGIIPCNVWYFGNWKLKYAPIHFFMAVRTLTAVNTNCHDGLIFLQFCESLSTHSRFGWTRNNEHFTRRRVYVYARISSESSGILIGNKSVSNKHCGAKQNVCLIHLYLLVLRLWELIIANLIQ